MNQKVLTEELRNVGIVINSYEFTSSGYVLDLSMEPDRAIGWEEIENLPVVGIELAESRGTGAYYRRVLFIPSRNKEFVDYVRKHMKYFCSGKDSALRDLHDTVMKYGTKNTKISVMEYLRKNGFTEQ